MVNSLLTRIQHVLLISSLLCSPTSGKPWISTLKHIPGKFLNTPPNCNPHNYSLILNLPDLCNKEDVFLLILVRSAPTNKQRRQSIRRTWGSLRTVQNETIRLAFIFGDNVEAREDLNRLLQVEHAKYRDILQESFKESYRTLNLKTVMAWKWSKTYCPKATFVMVINDEEFVDIFKTVAYLQSIVETDDDKEFMACWVSYEGFDANRDLNHKHGVSEKDYPGKQYPAFCNGNGYVASQETIRKLYKMSMDTPTFMPDDVWIGVLSGKLGLVIDNVHDRFSLTPNNKLIERYHTYETYANLRTILFPLDRLNTKCEVCIINYVWPRIMRYNNPPKKMKAKVKVKVNPPKHIFHVKTYFLLFLLSFVLNMVLLIHNYILYKRNVVLLSAIGIISIFVVLSQTI